MIGMLRGVVEDIGEGRIVLMCGDVGYEVLIPSGVGTVPPLMGDELRLQVVTLVRQDAIVLCGFMTAVDKRIFNKLLTIQGIGPRLALAMLGTLGGDGLLRAAASADQRRIQSVPGVGKKTAERAVLELKDKLAELAGGLGPDGEVSLRGADSSVLRQALEVLGFKRAEIDDTLRHISPGPDESEQQLVTRALKYLGSTRRK